MLSPPVHIQCPQDAFALLEHLAPRLSRGPERRPKLEAGPAVSHCRLVLQAKVSELEQQVDELNQRMSLLATDKANLDSRVNILVRVLRMRDEEISQLQQKLKVTPG